MGPLSFPAHASRLERYTAFHREPRGLDELYASMKDNEPIDPVGNEPSPLLFFGAALIPLLAIAGWAIGLFD